MRKVMHKWFWAWDFEKEEKWLNEMAEQGLALTSVGFCRYEFEQCLPGTYEIRLELLNQLACHEESRRYISFLEETGAECVGTIMRWVYFRKRTDEGSFELFSDNTSRIGHLNRILVLLGVIAAANLWSGIYNLFLCIAMNSAANTMGFLNLLLGGIIFCGFWKVRRMRKRLQKDKQIYE